MLAALSPGQHYRDCYSCTLASPGKRSTAWAVRMIHRDSAPRMRIRQYHVRPRLTLQTKYIADTGKAVDGHADTPYPARRLWPVHNNGSIRATPLQFRIPAVGYTSVARYLYSQLQGVQCYISYFYVVYCPSAPYIYLRRT